MKRTRVATLLTALIAVLALATGAPAHAASLIPPIHAAPAVAPSSCYIPSPYGIGASTTGPTGTIFTKQANSCLDLNLINADNGLGTTGSCYIGWYYNGSRWVEGAVGAVCKPNAPKFGSAVVLVSSIATGTRIGVSTTRYNATVTIEI